MHAIASSLSLCVASPPLVVWLRDYDQEPCVYGLGLFGHWHSWSCVLIGSGVQELGLGVGMRHYLQHYTPHPQCVGDLGTRHSGRASKTEGSAVLGFV